MPAPAAYGVFIEDAQARDGFTGVEDMGFRTFNLVHKLASQRGDAAHALHEVEDHTLARKNHASIVADDSSRLPGMHAHAIENFRMADDVVVRNDRAVECGIHIQNAVDQTDTGQNAILLDEKTRTRQLTGTDASVAGGIARRPVFEQRVL